MSTFASTAIPSEMMSPAMPEAVRVTGTNFMTASMSAKYSASAMVAMTPGSRYHPIMKSATRAKPTRAAVIPAAIAAPPKVGPMADELSSSIGTGSAPKFRLRTRSRASIAVKSPLMTAVPPGIASRITGFETSCPSRKMPSVCPTFSLVSFSNSVAPSLLKLTSTCGAARPAVAPLPNCSDALVMRRPVRLVGAKVIPPVVVACAEVAVVASMNSSVGVLPRAATAASMLVTPGRSTMSRSSVVPESTEACSVWTIGSATPKRFTRRSITPWSAPRASSWSPAGVWLMSAL